MSEKFIYSANIKTVRKLTYNVIQKFQLYCVWIFVAAAMIFGIYAQQELYIPSNIWLLMTIIFLPLILGFSFMVYVALHPKGPEADFILPGYELDEADRSKLKGEVILPSNDKLKVEVLVPNVYSVANEVLSSGMGQTASDGLSYEEMYELGLEEIRKKYPDCKWDGIPAIV